MALDASTRGAIIGLCNRAWGNDPEHDFAPLFELVTDSMHVIAYENDVLVSHACSAERWLEAEGLPPLRTAYVDAVATEPALQGRGFGAAVMRRFALEAAGYELNALASDRAVGFYEKLGWELWRGPTAVRRAQGVEPTPGENVLILRTASTPALDLTARLIADERAESAW